MGSSKVDSLLDEPWRFSKKVDSPDVDLLRDQLKQLYDELKKIESNLLNNSKVLSVSSTLPELVIQSLDDEQIWQQLELQNAEKLSKIKRKISTINDKLDDIPDAIFKKKKKAEDKNRIAVDVQESSPKRHEHVADDEVDNPDEFFSSVNDGDKNGDSEESDDSDQEHGDENPTSDKFFNTEDMDKFLDAQDKLEMNMMGKVKGGKDDDDDLDMLDEEDDEDLDDVDGSKNYVYKDFFVPSESQTTEKKRVHFEDAENESLDDEEIEGPSNAEQHEIDEEESDAAPKSTFEKRREKLNEKIEDLEQRNLSEKPWQMTGEVWAKHRPENSLLEEYVEFEHTTRLPPVITQETTQTLEDIVKQRIKDKAWDDVERKVKPINEPHTYKTDLILDQQKSKLSLSQIYEQEYLKHQQEEKVEARDEKQEEIKTLMRQLFVKLDALTNYHYTPKIPQNEIKIVNNTKSITMEEVAPATVNDADLLAPEEVKARNKSLQKSTDERTKTDKLRDLRRKKKLAKEKAERNEEKERSRKVPKDKLKMLRKLGKIHKVENKDNKTKKQR